MIGNDPSYPIVYQAFEKYAKRVGADLIRVTEFSKHNTILLQGLLQRHAAWFEKTQMGELLKKYDRVLYLDADILISPNAPDIFEKYSDSTCMYMLNEGLRADRSKAIQQITEILSLDKPWPEKSYYNIGVMLMSRESNLFEHVNIEELLRLPGKVSMYEQTYFNYVIIREGLKIESFSPDFNRMELFGQENYHQAYFIHYAGGGFCKHIKLRYRTILEDYFKLYNEPKSKFQRFIWKLKADVKFGWGEVVRNLIKIIKQIPRCVHAK